MPGNQPIIIKRIKKAGHGHHGGAWKVAYADFVTAMMAFFLLMWLLNAVSPDQLMGISNYFAPSLTTSRPAPGAGHILGGETIQSDDLFRNPPVINPRPATLKWDGGSAAEAQDENAKDETGEADPEALTKDQVDTLIAEREQQQFEDAMADLQEAIAGSPQLRDLGNSLRVENTPDGLHIQIVDQEGLPMFPRGNADMYGHTRALLQLVADVIGRMPQQVAVTGHTDATPFTNGGTYSNWELSADRANAARRTLIALGVPADRFSGVIGKAATEPLTPTDPTAPANRRLSVVLLRGTGDRSGTDAAPPPTAGPVPRP